MDFTPSSEASLANLPPELLSIILQSSECEPQVRQRLGMVCRSLSRFCFGVDDTYWASACITRFGVSLDYQPIPNRSWQLTFAALSSDKCYFHADKDGKKLKKESLWPMNVCADCRVFDEDHTLSKGDAMDEYKLTKAEVMRLPYELVHFRMRSGWGRFWAEKYLFNISQLQTVAYSKYGGEEGLEQEVQCRQAIKEKRRMTIARKRAQAHNAPIVDETSKDNLVENDEHEAHEVKQMLSGSNLSVKCGRKVASLSFLGTYYPWNAV